MILDFVKYQGTGNDFVMLDNRTKRLPKLKTDIISQICDRHFGVGADGIIIIENDEETDFLMTYYNPDGSETFCGNGGRCAVAFAKYLNIIQKETTFKAFDGLHFAKILENDEIALQMVDVTQVDIFENHIFANTGTQHHVELVDNLTNFPVFEKGKKLRYEMYGEKGSNINFVQQLNDDTFRVRTYEKGVENETLACGTGVTAVAIAMHKLGKTNKNQINLPVEGGTLKVSFTPENNSYTSVFLTGKAQQVFKGQISL